MEGNAPVILEEEPNLSSFSVSAYEEIENYLGRETEEETELSSVRRLGDVVVQGADKINKGQLSWDDKHTYEQLAESYWKIGSSKHYGDLKEDSQLALYFKSIGSELRNIDQLSRRRVEELNLLCKEMSRKFLHHYLPNRLIPTWL